MKRKKKVTVLLYCLGTLLLCIWAMFYQDTNMKKIRPELNEFKTGWIYENQQVDFPFYQPGEFVLTNTFPELKEDSVMLLKCRYQSISAYIDGECVFKTSEPVLNGISTNAGAREILVPLKQEYSGKEITVRMDLSESVYGSYFKGAYLTTNADYLLSVISKNHLTITFSLIFLVAGISYCIMASYFIIKKTIIRREFTFEALLYAGFFSVATGVWIACYSDLPGIITGNMVRSSIIGYIAFMVMPLAFLELMRSMNDKKHLSLTVLAYAEGIGNIVMVGLIFLGKMNWTDVVVPCHIMDAIDMIVAVCLAVEGFKNPDSPREKRIVFISNCVFVLLASMSFITYIFDNEGIFMFFYSFALTTYVFAQIVIIFNRIGVKASEDADYIVAKEYAFVDDLTSLGNRRAFYNSINEWAGKARNLTVVFIDVNRLKNVNDTLGHEAGDELLVGTGQCLAKSFGCAKAICRMGGDEFAIVMDSDEDEIKACISEMQGHVSRWRGKLVKELSVSVGYAIDKTKSKSVEELVRRADDDMYKNKNLYYINNGYSRRA